MWERWRAQINREIGGGKHSQTELRMECCGECIAETFPGPEGQRDRRVRPRELVATCSVSVEHIYCMIDLSVGYWLSQ